MHSAFETFPALNGTNSPQDLLDHYFKHVHKDKGCSGIQDLRYLDPAFASLLTGIRDVHNEALRLENANASGNFPHPPFHFDYVEATICNAYAFQYKGYAFIAVTLPLIELIWRISERLCRSGKIAQLLEVDLATTQIEDFHAILFVSQLSFLVAHEYTHHVHGHTPHIEFGSELMNADSHVLT